MIRPQNKTKQNPHRSQTHTQTRRQTHKHRHACTYKRQQNWRLFWKCNYGACILKNLTLDFIKKTLRYWSPCLALYLFFTFDLSFRLSSRHHETKPLGCSLEVGLLPSPLVNWSSCRNQWQGWVQTLVSRLGKRLRVSPHARIQKIQAVQDFLISEKISWNL